MEAQFHMWSSFHYFMMIFPFVLAIGLYYIFRNKQEKTKRIVAIILSVLMVIIIITRSIYVIDTKGGLNPEAIPFQVCHFANFVMLFAALFKNKVIGTIAWCLNFPAGLVSVIFADGLENYSNVLNIQGIAYISGHMLIVTVGLYMLLVNIIRIDKKSLIKMYIIVGAMFLSSIFVNNYFNKIFAHTNTDANYFYTFKPENGTPLEFMFNLGGNVRAFGVTYNPVYILLLILLAVILLYLMYLIYLLRHIKYK